MALTLKITFWVCIAAILYNYAGYPILLLFLGFLEQAKSDLVFLIRRKSRRAGPAGRSDAGQPRIAIVISAFNEESVIEARVKNVLEINYPPELTEILIGLDSPADSTASILSRIDSPRVQRFDLRRPRGEGREHNSVRQIVQGVGGTQQRLGAALLVTDVQGHAGQLRQRHRRRYPDGLWPHRPRYTARHCGGEHQHDADMKGDALLGRQSRTPSLSRRSARYAACWAVRSEEVGRGDSMVMEWATWPSSRTSTRSASSTASSTS